MFRVSRAHHAVGDDGSVVCPGFLGVPFFARIFEVADGGSLLLGG